MTLLLVDTMRPPPESRAVDVVSWLTAEHAWTRDLLALLLRMATDGRKWERVISVLTEDLWIHLQVEDELVYPALVPASDPVWEALVLRASVRTALVELEHSAARRFGVLRAAHRLLVLHELQVEHEERFVFSRARVLDSDAMELLAQKLRDRRSQLRQAGYHAIVRGYVPR